MKRLYFGLGIAALVITVASGLESVGGDSGCKSVNASSGCTAGCATGTCSAGGCTTAWTKGSCNSQGCTTGGCRTSGCSKCVAECSEKKSKKISYTIEHKQVCNAPVRVPGCGEILANICGNRTVGELKPRGNGCADECVPCEPCKKKSLLGRFFSCAANGQVRTVRVLKRQTKETTKSAVKWSVSGGEMSCATQGCTTRSN